MNEDDELDALIAGAFVIGWVLTLLTVVLVRWLT